MFLITLTVENLLFFSLLKQQKSSEGVDWKLKSKELCGRNVKGMVTYTTEITAE